jgi:hypothetical protein
MGQRQLRNFCAGFAICFSVVSGRLRQYQNVALAIPRRRQNLTTVRGDWRCASMIFAHCAASRRAL